MKDPAIPLPEETPNTESKRHMRNMFTAFFTMAKTWKQSTCLSPGEWMEKSCVCTMRYDSAIKRKKNEMLPPATTWMDLEGTVLSEVSQTERDVL